MYQLTDSQVYILEMLFDANVNDKPQTLVLTEGLVTVDYDVLAAYGFLTRTASSRKIFGRNAWQYRLSLSGCLVVQGITGTKSEEFGFSAC